MLITTELHKVLIIAKNQKNKLPITFGVPVSAYNVNGIDNSINLLCNLGYFGVFLQVDNIHIVIQSLEKEKIELIKLNLMESGYHLVNKSKIQNKRKTQTIYKYCFDRNNKFLKLCLS